MTNGISIITESINTSDQLSLLLSSFAKNSNYSPVEWIVIAQNGRQDINDLADQYAHKAHIRLFTSDINALIPPSIQAAGKAQYSNILFSGSLYQYQSNLLPQAIKKISSAQSAAVLIRTAMVTDSRDGQKNCYPVGSGISFECISTNYLIDTVRSFFSRVLVKEANHLFSFSLLLDKSKFKLTDLYEPKSEKILVGRPTKFFIPTSSKSFGQKADDKFPRANKKLTDQQKNTIAQAKMATAAKNWPEAASLWQIVHDASSDRIPPDIIAKLGQAHRKAGNLDAAEKILRQGRLIHPNFIPIATEYALLAMDRNDWPETIVRWQALLDNYGGKAPVAAFTGLAKAYRIINDFKEAEAVVLKGLEKYPNYINLSIEYAEIAMASQDFASAIKRWQDLIDTRPDKINVNVYRRLSIAYRSSRSFDIAENVIRLAKTKYPSNAVLATEYAEIAMAQRNWDLAIQRWQSILDIFGQNAGFGIYLRMSMAYCNKLDLEKAENIIHQGLTIYPDNIELLLVHAEIAMALGQWPNAASRWQAVFDTSAMKNTHLDTDRVINGKIPNWSAADWCHLAEYLKKNQRLSKKTIKPAFHLQLTEILLSVGFMEDASTYIGTNCRNYPDDPRLAIKNAELAMSLKNWPEAVQRWRVILDKIGPKAPPNVYACLGLAHHIRGNHNDAKSIIEQGAAHYPLLTGLESEFKEFDHILAGFRTNALHKSKISFNLICLDPDSIFASQVKCGLYLTKTEIASRLRKSIGDKMGAIDTSWAGRFTRNVTRKLSFRYGALNQNSPWLPAEILADALYFIFYTELSNIIPMRHLARKIAMEASQDPVFIEINSITFNYLNFWGPCDLESLYLYTELKKLGVNAFLCLNDKKLVNQQNSDFQLSLKFKPSYRFLRKPSQHYDRPFQKLLDKAICPDGIRGIDNILNDLGNIHVLTSTNLTLSRPYSSCNALKPVNFTASLYDEKLIPKEVTLSIKPVQNVSTRTIDGKIVDNFILQSDEYESNLFYWLDHVLGSFLNTLSRNAFDFVTHHHINEIHICDHFFLDSAIIGHAVKKNQGKVILWPHSTNPVLYNFRRPNEVDKIYCVMKSGMNLWKQYFPNTPIMQKADMMLPEPNNPEIKPAKQMARPGRLSVIIIGGVFTMGNLPRLLMNEQIESYKNFMSKLKTHGNDIDLFYKGKGKIADDLSCLRDDSGELLKWKSAMDHPLELDYPNMIYVSVSFGSSALLEGISRGIPAMIVRDFKVEDYTLLDPEYIPIGTSDEIVKELLRCLDFDYRMNLINRQTQYYCNEIGIKPDIF